MREVGFAYAQARIQARLAARPTAMAWQLIETGHSLAQALDAANRTALAVHVTRLGRDSPAAEIEAVLDDARARALTETARWLPPVWRASLMALAPLPRLRLARPEADEAGGRDAAQSEAATGAAWQADFAARLPGRRDEIIDALTPLGAHFLQGMPRAGDDRGATLAALRAVLRRLPQTPQAALAYGGVLLLDLERLTGALCAAALLPPLADEEAAA